MSRNAAPCEPASRMLRDGTARWLLAGVLTILVLVQGGQLASIGNGLGKHTDPHSEADALRSADAYARDGLTSHYGLPRTLYGSRFPNDGTIKDHVGSDGLVPQQFRQDFPAGMASPNEWVYTHYPPGPNLLSGLMAQAFGFERLWMFRLLPVGLSLLAVAVLFRELARAFGLGRGAVMAAACAAPPMVSAYMPGLHCQSYAFALLLLQIAVVLRLFWGGRGFGKWSVFALFMLGFLQGWLSFDPFFVMALLGLPLWLLRRAEGVPPPVSWLLLTAVLPVVGFVLASALHVLQVAADLGGMQAALAELHRTAAERGGQASPERFAFLRFVARASYLYLRETLKPTNLHFGPLMLLALAICVPIALRRKVAVSLPGGLRVSVAWPGPLSVLPALIAALFVSAVWMLFMPQHTVGNFHFTVRHFFLLYFCLVITIVQSLELQRVGAGSPKPAGLAAGT